MIEFPNMISAGDFETMLKQHAPVHGVALGATRFSILLQFLVESITLCLLGGILGIALGSSAAQMLSRLAGWEVFVSPQSVGLASFFSVAVGLFFGILPARRAAKLDPIEALRHE